MTKPDVIIVGGGMAGLCCARRLQQAGISSSILEAAGHVGGRVQTVEFRGFRLERGFQVLLTEYPEAKQVLEYEKLNLKCFEPGALVRYQDKFHRFSDPWRRPKHFIQTAFSPVASFSDKLRVARLRSRVCRGSLEDLNSRAEKTTLSKLHEEGFSERIIKRFFKPFLGGVFLEDELSTSSRKFEFVFRMFSQGDAAIPANGMGAIAEQLAGELSPDTVQTNRKVVQVRPGRVLMEDGQELSAPNVVIACEAPAAAKLLGQESPQPGHGVTCLYFSAESPPILEPILVLNGEGRGPINNLSVPSQLVPGSAPVNRALISVTVLGAKHPADELNQRAEVRLQLREWFGSVVDSWEHLKTFRIPYAIPCQKPHSDTTELNGLTRNDGIIMCGDYFSNSSINGAMVSGRLAAERVLAN